MRRLLTVLGIFAAFTLGTISTTESLADSTRPVTADNAAYKADLADKIMSCFDDQGVPTCFVRHYPHNSIDAASTLHPTDGWLPTRLPTRGSPADGISMTPDLDSFIYQLVSCDKTFCYIKDPDTGDRLLTFAPTDTGAYTIIP